jgi:hypothetical protein
MPDLEALNYLLLVVQSDPMIDDLGRETVVLVAVG